MCGITCLINLTGEPVDGALLGRMTRSLAHRGPESMAVWIRGAGVQASGPGAREAEQGIRICGPGGANPPFSGLGYTRRRIIDVEGGDQPIWNEDGTCLIVFNGEIYN